MNAFDNWLSEVLEDKLEVARETLLKAEREATRAVKIAKILFRSLSRSAGVLRRRRTLLIIKI